MNWYEMNQIKQWPEYYPDDCPPHNAFNPDGIYFRLINRNNPNKRDFNSYYLNKPNEDWGTKKCQAMGISIFSQIESCEAMQKIIPALRKKKIVQGRLSPAHGLIAMTPSSQNQDHTTWWIPNTLDEPWTLFSSIEVQVQ